MLWVVYPMYSWAQSTPVPVTIVSDPVANINRLSGVLEMSGASEFGEEIAKAIGNPEAKNLHQHLAFLERKKSAFSAIAYDRVYGGAVRQIVQYHYGLSESHPFIYFHYVYKQTGEGWRMTQFSFESETQRTFPSKYGIN
jgi:hypothetical protein